MVFSRWEPILQSVLFSSCSVFLFRATVVSNNLLLNSSVLILSLKNAMINVDTGF